MLARFVRMALCLLVATYLLMGFSKTHAQAQGLIRKMALPFFSEETSSTSAILYSQPPRSSGGLLPSSRWDPDGSDYDQWVWDSFSLSITGVITEIHWRGGYDPTFFGSGGPVIDFMVAIYASIPGGSQPDIVNSPLVDYLTGGNAGETPAGMSGNIMMYDYRFVLPTAFQASAGTRYWVQIEALQHGIPDWGITVGTGGDGYYFRKIHSSTAGYIYQTVPGDSSFALLGPPTHGIYLPLTVK